MYQVNIKVQLELLDNGGDLDWIKNAIQESLLESEAEKITKFLVASFPIVETRITPVETEHSNKTTITSQGPFFADANWDGRDNA
jgi:hypothetical protein